MCIEFIDMSKACAKDSFPLLGIDLIRGVQKTAKLTVTDTDLQPEARTGQNL